MNSTFASYHPAINFGFFVAVIGIGMFVRHPLFLAAGAAAALVYAIMLGGKGTLKFVFCFVVPMILLFALVNPIANPQGATVLFTFPRGQVTMEAIICGILSGLMLGEVLLWFSCYNRIMTSDKFIFLFGKVIPALSLIFSMVMRFVPNFRERIKKISDSQKCIGRDVTDGKAKEKIGHGMKIMSIMMTWSLESAIDTADSMKSRGYGLPGRTTFSVYRFDGRDTCAAVFLAVMAAAVIAGAISGSCSAEFFPSIEVAAMDIKSVITFGAYILLCFFPVAVEIKEAAVWKLSRSRI